MLESFAKCFHYFKNVHLSFIPRFQAQSEFCDCTKTQFIYVYHSITPRYIQITLNEISTKVALQMTNYGNKHEHANIKINLKRFPDEYVRNFYFVLSITPLRL